MKQNHLLQPHDIRDIGWKRTSGTATEHYYRHRMSSRIAVAHCGIVQYKNDMLGGSGRVLCEYCRTIEDKRDILEGDQYEKDSEKHYGS